MSEATEERRSPYVWLRQKIQPYYRPRPKNAKKKKRKEKPQVVQAKTVVGAKKTDGVASNIMVAKISKPLASFSNSNLPAQAPFDKIYYYHDERRHEVVCKFDKGAGFRYPSRSDRERKKLKPTIYPKGVQYDRTHLIPIGYHGSENSPILLVGWDSQQNRGPLAEFEKKIKRAKYPIFWHTVIERTNNGAVWHYRIYDGRNPQARPLPLVASLDVEMSCPFFWTGADRR